MSAERGSEGWGVSALPAPALHQLAHLSHAFIFAYDPHGEAVYDSVPAKWVRNPPGVVRAGGRRRRQTNKRALFAQREKRGLAHYFQFDEKSGKPLTELLLVYLVVVHATSSG